MQSSVKFQNLANTPLFQVPFRPPFGHPPTPQTCPRRPRTHCNMKASSSASEGPKPKKPYGYWKRVSNVLYELELFMNSRTPRPTTMPTAHELAEAGRHDLAGAIRRHTWRKIAEAANLPLSSLARPRSLNLSYCTTITAKRMRPYMYWREWENVERELREFIREHCDEQPGHPGTSDMVMPTASELVDRGRSDLKRAVLLHGGSWKVAKRMGFVPKSRPVEYWNEEVVVEELTRIAKRVGREGSFPTHQDIQQFGARGLPSAVRRFGGARALAAKMGLTLRCKSQKR